jgi:hypothetical protein
MLRWLTQLLKRLLAWLEGTTITGAIMVLGPIHSIPKGDSRMKTLTTTPKGAPNPNANITDIQSDGATLLPIDAAGNVVGTFDPTLVSVSWSTSDQTILAVTANPTNPLAATIASTGELGTASVLATITFLSGAPAPVIAEADITVTTSAIVSATMQLGTPTP